MATIFSKIVDGEIPCYKVAEDDHFLAFLDVMPLCKGHVLVIPKKETDYLFDLDEKELSDLMCFAKNVAVKMKLAISCRKIGMTVIGLEVPHAHVHLIPINTIADMDFTKPKLSLSSTEMAEISQLIMNQ